MTHLPTATRERRNLELKVPFELTADRQAVLAELGAIDAGTLEQVDTYFHCSQGRLKLREIKQHRPMGEPISSAELITYMRADQAGVRTSHYQVVAVPDADALRSALAASLGVRVVVRKRRRLLLWHNVRIHLDDVESLGTYLEFEAVIDAENEETVSQQRLDLLRRKLHLDQSQTIAAGYADLLLRGR